MLYRFAHVLMWITFRIFFRRIEVLGKDGLSPKKPVILIANHPASFLDAMVLAVFLSRPLHFYVRGDIFKHPLAYRLLTLLHMIPIYSQDHGTKNLWRNKRTFERGRRLLSEGKLLLIFPEGFSRLSKQLVPLKKGAARVALQTAFGNGVPQELLIQTVAINYSYHGFGSDLFIRMGETMGLHQYQDLFISSPAHAVNALTRDMQDLFERNVIHIQQGDRTAAAETLINIACRERPTCQKDFFMYARKICAHLSAMQQDEFDSLTKEMASYCRRLQQQGLSATIPIYSSSGQQTKRLATLILLFPVYFLGTLIWVVPGRLSKWIADKTVTRIDFYTSVHSAVMAFVGLIWWACLIWAVLFAQFHVWAVIIFFSPLLLYVSLRWRYMWKEWFEIRKWNLLQKKDPQAVQEIVAAKENLLFY